MKPKFAVARWSPKFAELRALSLRQPWAWLVVNGYKDIENRSWRTNHRGALLIDSPVSHTLTCCHAGFTVHLTRSRGSIHASSTTTTLQADLRRVKNEYGVDVPANLKFGGVVGTVDVVDCVKTHPSKWKFHGSWGWVLKNPERLPFRKCKGAVGFFRLKSTSEPAGALLARSLDR